jgi:extracellular elastinolytic metalloproteinase
MLPSIATVLAVLVTNGAAIQQATHQHGQVDVTKYRFKTTADYVPSHEIPHTTGLVPRGTSDYVETATNFLKQTIPNVTFRVVPDHYIGADGIGHVYFKQTFNGLDIDDADFNVNVSTARPTSTIIF